MPRRLLPLALLAAALWPRAAGAQPIGGSIDMELRLPDADGTFAVRDELTVREHFNTANCVCGDVLFGVWLSLTDVPPQPSTLPVDIWTGARCDDQDPTIRDENCTAVTTIPEVEDLRSPDLVEIPVADLVSLDQSCPERENDRTVYALVDPEDDGIDENDDAFSLPIFVDTRPPPVPTNVSLSGTENGIIARFDPPTSRTDDLRYVQLLCARTDGTFAEGETGGIEPRYLTPQMACPDATSPSPRVWPAAPAPGGGDAGPSDGGVADAGPIGDAGPGGDAGTGEPLPPGLDTLDPMFLCGEANAPTTSVTATGLENGVEYRVVLAAVDQARNVQLVDLGTAEPQPVRDGWEHYQDAGGQAEGGYCFIATASYGDYDHPWVLVLRDFRDGTLARFGLGRAFIDWYYETSPPLARFLERHPAAAAVTRVLLAPLVVFAAFWEYTGALAKLGLLLAFGLALHLRRRRRGPAPQPTGRPSRRARVAAAGVAALALLALSATASAQPYWDEYNQPVQAEIGAATPRWNFEIKLGPYTPAVDSEFDLADDEAGPFEAVYGGGPFLLTQLAIDRFLLTSVGQLGVSASVGFLRRSASPFELDANGDVSIGDDGEPVRVEGASTSFYLIPTALSAVYRATQLDDHLGIPLVPYGRLGLAYYIWSFSGPNGTAETPTDDCPEAGAPDAECSGNVGRGGSLGWQGSVGLALRAERIDPGAERSLRTELGIEHAGFFVELTYASVDGFGAADKLAVGDLTWFGGVNFEF